MAYLKILLLFVVTSDTEACLRSIAVYQMRDPALGLVYEYHDSDAAHPGRGFERVDGTNNNHSVPTFALGLKAPAENGGSTILRVCSLAQPGRTEALHFLVLSSECEDLRQYTSQPSDTHISQTMHIYVPVSNTPPQDSEIAILPFHATVCRGPGDIIYSTLTTMEDTFCNPTHDSVHDFMFYAFALYPDYCPLLTPEEGHTIRYEHTAGVNGVTAVYGCLAGYDLQQGQTGRKTCNDQSQGQWTGATPTCERVYCGSPPTIAHGEYIYVESDVASLSTVRLECYRGYVANAEDILTCHRDGWSQQNGHCQRVNCGAPPLTDHGAYVDYLGQPSEYESTVILQCDDGFITSHSHPILTCLATGQWSSHGYHCRSPNCGDPGIPFDGRRIGDDFSEDAIIQFFCNAGFTLVGASAITCQSGQWSVELPQCSVVPCLAPPHPDHGIWTWDAVNYGTILFQCMPGFLLEGYNSSTCYNGRWQRRNPICIAPACEDPGIPEHGSRAGSQFHHQAFVQFFCDGGFVLEGEAMAICDAGLWTADTPTCQPVDCPELPAVENGVWFWDTYHPGRVQFWCLPGYELQVQSYSVCYEGRWRSTMPRCTACVVGQYKEGLNNEVCQRCPERSSTESAATGSREGCICQPGTRPSEDGSSCRDIGCPPFPPMENGRRGWQVYDFGIAISFECFPGYEIMGHHFSICQSDDTWSSEAPWCRPCPMGYYKEGVNNANCSQCPTNMITSSEASDSCECVPGYRPVENGIGCEVPMCPCINPPEHGAVTVRGFMPGSAATYSCLPGFQLQGTVNSQCLSSGTWSHDIPLCVELFCPELEQPSNGIKLQTSDDNVIGTVVVFRCNTGYEILGDELLDCVENEGQAVWSAQPPLCVEA